MRSRLRSPTGCLRCRQRRKKCGEEKPVCAQCQKLHSACIYPLLMSKSEILSSQRHIESLRTSLMIQDKYGTSRQAQLTPTESWPVRVISSGFEPFESEFEQGTLISFRNFLDSLQIYRGYCDRLSFPPLLHHEMTVALIQPWVRKPLLAFATTVIASPRPLSSHDSYERYHVAVRTVHSHLLNSNTSTDKEQLLVATFLMALIEVSVTEV